jgi:hypothetical protein
MGAMSFLKTMFPFISAAASLGGPLGTMAANAVGKALGVDKVDASPNGIESAITKAGASPEQIAAMQKAEQDFQVEMQKLGFDHVEDLEKIAADDRANARSREIQVKDKMPMLLGLIVTSGFFGIVILMCFHAFPADTKDTLLMLLGALAVGWKDVMGYFFGSSAGSDAKNEIISNLSK